MDAENKKYIATINLNISVSSPDEDHLKKMSSLITEMINRYDSSITTEYRNKSPEILIPLEKKPNFSRLTIGINFILPTSIRKDFRIDIQDVIEGMILEKKSSIRITLVVIASFISVFCHTIYFKIYNFVSSKIEIK